MSLLVCFLEVICVAEMDVKVSDCFISTGLQKSGSHKRTKLKEHI